jgi:outer membrane protein assembly factor BamB
MVTLLIFNILFYNIQSQTLNVTKNNLIKEIKSSMDRNERDYPEILWWYDLNAPCFGSAATDDFDNDNNLELVFGTYFNDEQVYALNANNGSLLWNYDTGGCNDASPVISDVDLDGELEVIIPASSPYEVYCFDGSTGQVEWSTSTGYPNCIDSPPAIADVDNDDKPEVILGAWYGNVFCLNGEDGSICWQIILGSDSYFQAGPNILDLDNDGQLDVVIAQYAGDCRIYALKGNNGSVLWYSDLPQDYMYHGGSFADIDEDGFPEIVIGCYDNYVYVLNGEDGSILWDYNAPYYIASPTSIADLNNDDHLEIVFTSYNYLGVLSYTGELLWSYTAGGSMFRGASIADIDGNGILDVVFGADDGILRVLQGDNGQVVWTLDLEAHYQNVFQIDNAPVIDDFNNDGKLDIFIIGGYGTSDPPDNNHGRGYAIAAGNGTGEGWPMFRHDVYHSACFHFQQNQVPIAIEDYTYTFINESVWINVTANDYDLDGEINLTTVNIVDYPTNGLVQVNPITGNISYTPNTGFVGKDILNYTVCDDEGLISNKCQVIIYVITSDMIFVGLPLENDWNLITIPTENGWWASDIADNLTDCNSVSHWDAVNQTYKTYIVGGPPTFDFAIMDGCGYFVDMNQPDYLLIYGLQINTINVSLEIGWNLLGWYHSYNTTASSLSENITGCTSVSMWNANVQTYDTYIVGGPPTFDFTVTCGIGVFVDVTEESIWYGEG